MVIVKTNMGDITLELDFENTPKTAENFMQYAKSGFYEGTIFHRVIKNFMVQGGGLNADMENKEGNDPIENEGATSKANKRGTIAMARTSDPHSASSQFFINVVDNEFLNFRNETQDGWGYCVFAEVTDGMDVVDAMKAVATGSSMGHQDVPVEAIVIEKVEVVEE